MECWKTGILACKRKNFPIIPSFQYSTIPAEIILLLQYLSLPQIPFYEDVLPDPPHSELIQKNGFLEGCFATPAKDSQSLSITDQFWGEEE
jgi:hypothetical protein